MSPTLESEHEILYIKSLAPYWAYINCSKKQKKSKTLLLFTIVLVFMCQVLGILQERKRYVCSHQRAYIYARISYLL